MVEPEKMSSRILVVDDEESLRLTFKMFLSREGYGPVKTAATFEEAMELINNEEFDLIISDIVMDGESGIELLRRVRELCKECPVVMVTGYPNIGTAAEAVRLGAFDYLAKPVKKDDLLRTARMALQQFALWREKMRADRQMERYRQDLETVFRSVRDMIVTVDPELKVSQINERARQWAANLELDLEVGSSLKELPTPFRVFVDDASRVLESRQEVEEHQVELELDKLGRVVFRISGVPLEGRSEQFIGAMLLFRDVTCAEYQEQRTRRTRFHRLAGGSPAMQAVYTMIENVGPVDVTVLITGESGTGKELVVEALHAESPRRGMPLVKVDCTSIPENLLESELFGHKRGSFTGADRHREGRILQADGGTLFLDEVGDISLANQVRLLRFLQERTFYPVGGDQPVSVDVRVVAATNADLRRKVQLGEFREDLYYRLRVVDIHLPPLRKRETDLELLARLFMERFSKQLNKSITAISDQALQLLMAYRWPGNVRELEHVIERACVLCAGSTITSAELSVEVLGDSGVPPMAEGGESVSAPTLTERAGGVEGEGEEERIVRVLRQTDGNKAKTARLLGIDRSTLYRKMKQYQIAD
ncbi:MAG TPA: response regulator [Desulfurivibrio alkaliphilus]|uniref:Response regulator n=1 Tax=Desulfurivibrio alkaliphilus TaxID=427923 RepID=A0A7C2THI4_9BACT|nr:response regulator [Desulfurivibrio alkaliphilus]